MNNVFNLASDIVCHTSQSVFLTGKAGTGKTTFLHHIRKTTDKNVIIAAPTGVAAINAGGVTLHSLLQLPFEPYIPNFEGKKKLDFHFKLRKSKIEMLRELDLLIIDEVSMLRADTLDAADYMLRRYRNNQHPFGGIQVLFIGDMFQLPPVVQAAEWEAMKHHYPSPFFFHAQALENFPLMYIELKKIYRQQDQRFIDILNRVRNNCTSFQDLQLLNQNYNPSFKLPKENRYIVLCTHNYKADRINREEIRKLSGKEFRFEGKIHGDFSENALPAEYDLVLKEGAQIMFVKNDVGERRRFYNGKLAIVNRLKEDKIEVCFENGDLMDLEQDTWRNVRYKLNENSGEIEEEELGAYTQYPIRLAWAVTIHKSQGLTFDRVVVDAGQAFAAGQVYVALSRCTSLDGIVLFSRITQQSISTDPYAIEFSKNEQPIDFLERILESEKPRYCALRLKKYFDWTPFIRSLRSLYDLASEKKIPDQEEVQAMFAQMCSRAVEQQEIAQNFIKELDRILSAPIPDIARLKDRVEKAVTYFHKDISENILLPLKLHLERFKTKSKVKAYLTKATEIHNTLLSLLSRIEHINYGDMSLTRNLTFIKTETPKDDLLPKEKNKPQKGDSHRLTLSLFNEGKSVKEIAAERNLATTTIEGHLVSFILTGELDILQLVPNSKVQYMLPFLKDTNPKASLSAIKEIMPEGYTYMDIKAVLNYMIYLNSKK